MMNVFFWIMKIRFLSFFFFFLYPVFHRRQYVCLPQSTFVLFSDFALQRMRCSPQFASHSCARAPFSSASGCSPPLPNPPPLGITNSAGWQLCLSAETERVNILHVGVFRPVNCEGSCQRETKCSFTTYKILSNYLWHIALAEDLRSFFWGKIKLNESGRQKPASEKLCQQARRAKLYSNLPLGFKRRNLW